MSRRTRRQVLRTLGTGAALGLAGCSDGVFEGTETATQATLSPSARYAYTHVQPSGNRVLDGAGSVRDADPVEIPTDSKPFWLLALPAETGSYWTVVTILGSVRTVRVADGTATRVSEHTSLPAGMPPLARRSSDGVGLVRPRGDTASLTHPVVTESGLLFIAESGDLVLQGGDGTQRWQVDALRDGRIVHVAGSRYALLGDRTTRYRHGALGGNEEGGSLVVFDAASPEVLTRRTVGPPAVIEGLAPLVADLDGDGSPEILTTVSDSGDGARIVVFDASGNRIATGPIHGSGWRHQLAVAPFGPDEGLELAVTRKPHVDRVVEFYRLSGGNLTITAEVPNVSTHTYGSFNTDGAVAGDLDGDGRVEVIVPNTRRESLLVIRRTESGTAVDWRYSLGSELTTNLTGVALPDGRVAVGAGTSDGVTVWQG